MHTLVNLIDLAYNIFIGIIIVQVAVSWLIAFDVINAGNQRAQNLISLLRKATDPVYKPIQKYIPPIGGIDLTPLIVILLLSFLRDILIRAII
jgi:YggT family protein